MRPETLSIFDISSSHDANDLIEWANVQGKGYIEIRFFPYDSPSTPIISLGPK
jgi:hypothetical protein